MGSAFVINFYIPHHKKNISSSTSRSYDNIKNTLENHISEAHPHRTDPGFSNIAMNSLSLSEDPWLEHLLRLKPNPNGTLTYKPSLWMVIKNFSPTSSNIWRLLLSSTFTRFGTGVEWITADIYTLELPRRHFLVSKDSESVSTFLVGD